MFLVPLRNHVPRVGRALRSRRNRGAASILAMMFLVIFGSLAAAMAIVAQGNLATADSYLKIHRSLAAAETGMNFTVYRLNQVTATIKTRDGLITANNAPALWNLVRPALAAALTGDAHNLAEPVDNGVSLTIGAIAAGPGGPVFTATLTPHPLAGENYDAAYYQRAPYNQMTPAVSAAHPLDATWIRVKVRATDGATGHQVVRAIQMDFQINKKIPYAILSKSRVMIGKNVSISGPVCSAFLETSLPNGHPVQMQSDFYGLDPALDTQLNTLAGWLKTNDKNGDNRINLADPNETQGIDNPAQYDADGDGYITDFDFFLAHYDTQKKGYVNAIDLNTANNVATRQLMQLIDTSGDPNRPGYNDGKIDANDYYAKIHGEVKITSDLATWQNGAAGGNYQQYFQGPIVPDPNQPALTFQASDSSAYTFQATDFDVSSYKNLATGSLADQAAAQAANYNPGDPNSPQPLGTVVREAVPYGSAHPYDYYDRPVYQNMTFTNTTIPQGSNALFINCKFVGTTFVDTGSDNSDPNYNYAGMQQADGTQKYPGMTVMANGTKVTSSKTISNNVRFDGCTFEGSVVAPPTPSFTQVRNKLQFTGQTTFNVTNSQNLTADQKALYSRSSILTPNYSIEMGTFVLPSDPNQTVNLTGTIVAGIIDIRGQVKVDGTILTTYQPQSDVAPVIGPTSPNFNITLGYFGSADGDLEEELPPNGLGVVQIRYDATLPLPDGVLGPIQITANAMTYCETGGN